MDVKLFKPPSLVNLAGFDGNTSRRPESQGSITGWSDDRGPILTKFPTRKENHPSHHASRKETSAFQTTSSDVRPRKPTTAGNSFNDLRRRSGLRKIAERKESSFAAALNNAASESSLKRPIVLRKLHGDNDLKTTPDTYSTVECELQSRKEGFQLKSRTNKRNAPDLREIYGHEHTVDFPTSSFAQDIKEKTNSSPFHPKLKPRHHSSIKNKETTWNRAARNISLSSPVYRESSSTKDEENTKTMLNRTWARKPKEEEGLLILYANEFGRETRTNFTPDKKKATAMIKPVKNAYLHLTRKNFMGISMLVSSQKSGTNKAKNNGQPQQPAIVGLANEADNIELFRQYLDKITSTNKNTHGAGILKDKIQGITLDSKDSTANLNFSKSVEKESRTSPNVLYTKGIREAKIKRGESNSPKPMSAYDYLLFNSPIKVTAYNKSLNSKKPIKLTDQLIFTDADYCL